MSALAVAGPAGTRLVPLADAGRAFQPNLLASRKAVWDQQVWMAQLGPNYTGNQAHTTFVEFLAAAFQKAGCDVARERDTLPRMDDASMRYTATGKNEWSVANTPDQARSRR